MFRRSSQLDFEAVQLVASRVLEPQRETTSRLRLPPELPVATTSTTTNGVTVSTQTVAGTPDITATASGANLQGGGDAATLAPGTIVAIQGSNLSDNTLSTVSVLPTLLYSTRTMDRRPFNWAEWRSISTGFEPRSCLFRPTKWMRRCLLN